MSQEIETVQAKLVQVSYLLISIMCIVATFRQISIIISIFLIIQNFADYDLVKMGFDCKSKEEKLKNEFPEPGEHEDLFGHAWKCANACQKIVGCNFFSYKPFGYSGLASCWWKKTETANCSEGWMESRYKSFFAMISMSD